MWVRPITLIAALIALALIPSTAFGAPKKVFLKWSSTAYSVGENAGHFDITVQRSGNTAHSQSWTVEAAENVSSEYDQRKRRAHARSVGT